ncbi:Gfo/Idh/MocA family protein [Paenibacillus harenae]|uniref:Gfo/Idh/MocA family protein n=1 Tax=Paenibacillus harenae TaxID=306543 RepID=UPI0004056A4D|nr:Gfo/Idh/MocA family oxidoreductase [Paenibacillus harenae]
MSDHLSSELLLIGAGKMAAAYARVFRAMNRSMLVIGRGPQSAVQFERETGIPPITGGLETGLSQINRLPETAVVALPVEGLAEAALCLLSRGVKRLLLEKPGALNGGELHSIREAAKAVQAEVFIAYNRRFYASTRKAIELIEEDGGVSSFHFEFSEWSHLIARSAQSPEVKKQWFLANSTHVADLAFFLGGPPRTMNCFISGALSWHPAAAAFSGAGSTDTGALFSYHANWIAPGRWGIELMTRKRRLIMRPLEQLYVQQIGSTAAEQAELEDEIDLLYKPGLYRLAAAFLDQCDPSSLITIGQQCDWHDRFYAPMIGAGNL